MSAHATATAREDRGCDWQNPRGERCDRPDLVVAGDGDHICTVHADAWMDAQRARREELSRWYVTRGTNADAIECEMPVECPGCGSKRSRGGALCRSCVEHAAAERSEQRHRDRDYFGRANH